MEIRIKNNRGIVERKERDRKIDRQIDRQGEIERE